VAAAAAGQEICDVHEEGHSVIHDRGVDDMPDRVVLAGQEGRADIDVGQSQAEVVVAGCRAIQT
jgi:hypothetical protein